MVRRRHSSKKSKKTNENGPWLTRPELTDRLVALHETTALSARKIAETLTSEFEIEITRGQVIGKATRLGLTSRVIPSRPYSYRPLQKPKPVKPALVVVPEPARPPSIQVDRSSLRVATLPIVRQGTDLCRWLYDDYPYACCSEPKLDGSSYCGWHDRQVHVPAMQCVAMRGRS